MLTPVAALASTSAPMIHPASVANAASDSIAIAPVNIMAPAASSTRGSTRSVSRPASGKHTAIATPAGSRISPAPSGE